MPLPFGVWFTRALLPMLGVLIAMGLLVAASLTLILEALTSTARWNLFFAGLNTWIAAIVWGTWINGRPLPPKALRAAGLEASRSD